MMLHCQLKGIPVAGSQQFLLAVLAQDPQVRPGTFHEGFSAEDFVDLLFSLLLAALLRKDAPCAPILALIRRTIY